VKGDAVTSFNRATGKKSVHRKSFSVAPDAEGTNPGQGQDRGRRLSGRPILLAALAVAGLAAGGLAFQLPALRNAVRGADSAAATFVGSDTCAGCHQSEARLWQSSHHKLAMDHATEKTVLGDFNEGGFD
jgi:hypothetical protein